MNQNWKSIELNKEGDLELSKYETRLKKYLDRMYEIVQCKSKLFPGINEDGIFKELDKVIACQLNIDIGNTNADKFTQVPLVDIILNIDLFCTHFEDKTKVLTIIKELFNHCTDMKRLL